MKYRKKPIVIEAEQWFRVEECKEVGCTEDERRAFPVYHLCVEPYNGLNAKCSNCNGSKGTHGWIDTLEGGHIVCPGDWIITGVRGERYPCKPGIFEATYERVEG